MKRVVVERPVKDIEGLLASLQKEMPSSVMSVASDTAKTYVYLQDTSQEDPTERVMAWQDPPELMVTLEGDLPAADGKATASVIVSYVEPFTKTPQPGQFKVRVSSKLGLKLSPRKVSLKTGRAVVALGPTTEPLIDTIYINDPFKRFSSISIDVPFAEPPPSLEDDKTGGPPPSIKARVWGVFRRLRPNPKG